MGFAVAAAAHLDVEVLAVHAGSLVPGALTGIAVPTLDTILTAVHDSKRQLMVWCPSPRRVRPLLAAGVDAIVVDDLPRYVREYGGPNRQVSGRPRPYRARDELG